MIKYEKIWNFINKFNPKISELSEQNADFIIQNKLLIDEKSALLQEIKNLNNDTELDKYCKDNFKRIKNIAYKQKRNIKSQSYSIYLNEMITPNAFEVKKFFKGIDLEQGSNYDIANRVGKKISANITWIDDKNLSTSGDYYLSPSETLQLREGDCEDHVFISCSVHPEIAGAWGFYKTTGHAFNVFVFLNELWILDTVGDTPIILKYKDQKDYTINYIITRDNTYEVDGSTDFGEIAWG